MTMPLVGSRAIRHVLSHSESAADSFVERLRAGEPAAVGELYDRHHQAVRAFACRLLGDETAAEDLVQEVFVSVPRAMRRYEGRASFQTFLISIAVNHARHFVRAASRRRAALQRFAEQPSASQPPPDEQVRRQELAQALNRALDTLPVDQRVAFVLCEVEERTSREAASIVGVPEATVRTRLFHARKKLRAALEREGVR